MTTPPPESCAPAERKFVMAYGFCSIWRLLEGPNRGEYVVSATDAPRQEWTVATLPAAHRMCLLLECRHRGDPP